MNELAYKELIDTLEQMIHDKVQLIHGGQIIDWEETKIPEILQKIKKNVKVSNRSNGQNGSIQNNNK